MVTKETEYEGGNQASGRDQDGEYSHQSSFWRRLGSTNGTGPFMRWTGFFMFVVVVVLAAISWQVEQRNDAIHEIQSAAVRIEDAATHTEEVLLEVVEARETPEAIQRNDSVTRALAEIGQIKAILCDTVEHAACQEEP